MLNTKVSAIEKAGKTRARNRSTAKAPAEKTRRASSTWCSSRSDAVPSPTTSISKPPGSTPTNADSSPSTASSARKCRTSSRSATSPAQPLLAHRAMKQGVVAAEVINGDRSAAFDPVAVPNCVYTDPEVATVGLSEEEAKACRLRGAHRKVSARGQRTRPHDERERRHHQARRRCQDRPSPRHAHRRAAGRVAHRRRRHRARDGRDARRHRPLGASASDASPKASWTPRKPRTARRYTSSIPNRRRP